MSNIGVGTTGQLVQATATNTGFLTTGSAGQVLSVSGGVPTWVNLSTVLNYISAVVAATTANLNATYLNGVSGVGATLINAGTLAAFSVDGQSPAINSRILVKNQTSTFQNGIYTLTTVGTGAVAWVLTRSTDYNTPAEISVGDIVPVQLGTINADTSWIQGATVTTIGTDPITFTQFSSAPITTTQYDVLVGGANNTIASVGPGSAGQVLQSAGNAANPVYSTATFPAVATGTGSFLRADGTNWVASTPTLPNAAVQGDILYASAASTWTQLAKDANSTRSLTNTGASNSPAWAQVALGTGVSGQLPLANGGTNANLTASNGGIFYSSSTAGAILSGTATAGQHLQSGASAAPTWTTATFPSTATGTGKILIADGTNWVASTPTYPNTSGTAGKVIISDGTNNVYSTPTFPNASATTRKIIVSDGTNWVASTETYAVPGASGNLLTSDGTNWTSAAVKGTTISTWTPAIAFGGGTTGITYTTQSGYYTQIGNIVFISGHVLLSSKGSSTGVVTMTALPVTPSTNAASFTVPIPYVQHINTGGFNLSSILFSNGSTSGQLWAASNGSDAASAQMTNANFTNTSEFIFTGFYFIV